MPETSVLISFPDSSSAEGNRFAGTLAETLLDLDPSIEVQRVREGSETQDFGATLVVVLGTTAVTALARGFGSWLARNSGARMEIRRGGEVVLTATYLNSADVPKLAAALKAAGLANV
jgi:hypothetical protein